MFSLNQKFDGKDSFLDNQTMYDSYRALQDIERAYLADFSLSINVTLTYD